MTMHGEISSKALAEDQERLTGSKPFFPLSEVEKSKSLVMRWLFLQHLQIMAGRGAAVCNIGYVPASVCARLKKTD